MLEQKPNSIGHIVCLLTMLVVFNGAVLAQQAAPGAENLPDGWYARIETSQGIIVVELLPQQAPQAVAHIAGMANGEIEWFDPINGKPQKGHYYDGIEIHLAEAGRRFEAGDRSANGLPAPPMYAPPEGFGPVNFSSAGRMAVPRIGGGRISAVQFFLTASGMPWLNGRHPCVGKVISGQDVISRISSVKTLRSGRPIEPQTIDKLRVFSVGTVEPLADPQPYFPKREGMRRYKYRGRATSGDGS